MEPTQPGCRPSQEASSARPVSLRQASEGVLQRLDGPLHFFQEDPQRLAKPLRLRRGDRPFPGRPDEPLVFQDAQRVPDAIRRMPRELPEPDDADGLVFLHGLQEGNVAAEQLQVFAYPVGQRDPFNQYLRPGSLPACPTGTWRLKRVASVGNSHF